MRDGEILGALLLSLKIAFLTAGASVVLGTLAAFSLVRYRRFRGRTLFTGMVHAPLVMPEVVVGPVAAADAGRIQRATERPSAWGFPSAAC